MVPWTVLIVEDDDELREILAQCLQRLGHRILAASSAEAALNIVAGTPPDLVLTDVHMGGMSGIELCRRLKADTRFQLMPVILLTGVSDLQARVAGLAAGADDFFAKPCDLVELETRVSSLLKLKSLVDQLERAESVITTLGLTIEARDPYTRGHCGRLARYAQAVGQVFGLDAGALRALGLGGFLHDLGKIAIPDRILLKPGPLDAEDRQAIQTHPVVGAGLVQGLRSLEAVVPIIRHHHERMDGSGYPDRLSGEAIPVTARVLAVVDVYDALRTARPYKPALSFDEAVTTLRRETDAGWWDPRVVDALRKVVGDGAMGEG